MNDRTGQPADRDDRTKKMTLPTAAGSEHSRSEESKPLPRRKIPSRPAGAGKPRAHGISCAPPAEKFLGKYGGKKAGSETANRTADTKESVDALLHQAETDEQRRERIEQKRRASEQRAHRAEKDGRSPAGAAPFQERMRRTAAKSKVKAKSMISGAKAARPSVNSRDLSMLVTVAGSVVVLLLIIWFTATQFMGAVGDQGSVALGETQSSEAGAAQESEQAEETSSAAAAGNEESASSAASASSLTAGDGDPTVAETWVGKTFTVEDEANVRSGAGTANSILGTVDPGDKVEIRRAEMADGAAWAEGVFTLQNGRTLEGWIYTFALDPTLN